MSPKVLFPFRFMLLAAGHASFSFLRMMATFNASLVPDSFHGIVKAAVATSCPILSETTHARTETACCCIPRQPQAYSAQGLYAREEVANFFPIFCLCLLEAHSETCYGEVGGHMYQPSLRAHQMNAAEHV